MKNKQGSGLIFAVVLLFVILGMVITLSSITVLETKMSQKTKSSVGAFYNSESGVEWALNKIANSSGDAAISTLGSCPFTDCRVLFLGEDGKVLATSATIDQVKAVRSIGSQGGETQRAIEAAVAGENLDCQDYTLDDPAHDLKKNIGGINYPICFNGVYGSGGPAYLFPIASIVAQKFCEEEGYDISFPKNAKTNPGVTRASVSYDGSYNWETIDCAMEGLVLRCCK